MWVATHEEGRAAWGNRGQFGPNTLIDKIASIHLRHLTLASPPTHTRGRKNTCAPRGRDVLSVADAVGKLRSPCDGCP